MIIDWNDGRQSGGDYLMTVEGDITRVMGTLACYREWQGYVTTVGGGITRMMHDLQDHRNSLVLILYTYSKLPIIKLS